MHREGRRVEAIEQLSASRQLRRNRKVPQRASQSEGQGITVTNAAVYQAGDEETDELRRRFADAAQEAGYELESELDTEVGSPRLLLAGTTVSFDGRAFGISARGCLEDAAIVALFVRRLEWPGLVVEGGARLADLMAIAAASEDVFMVNRAPSAGARDIISRAFFHELKESIARYDPSGVAVKPLTDFEAIMACADVGVSVEETIMRANAASDDHIASSEDRENANSGPVKSGKLADPPPALMPIAAPLDNDAQGLAAGSDVGQSTGSLSEAIDDLESLPDDDSWMTRPGPGALMQNGRDMQAYDERQRQRLDDFEAILRRMRDQSSRLCSEDIPAAQTRALLPPTEGILKPLRAE